MSDVEHEQKQLSELFTAVTVQRQPMYREEKFIFAHRFGGFGPLEVVPVF